MNHIKISSEVDMFQMALLATPFTCGVCACTDFVSTDIYSSEANEARHCSCVFFLCEGNEHDI